MCYHRSDVLTRSGKLEISIVSADIMSVSYQFGLKPSVILPSDVSRIFQEAFIKSNFTSRTFAQVHALNTSQLTSLQPQHQHTPTADFIKARAGVES
jgi:hypothetical protein